MRHLQPKSKHFPTVLKALVIVSGLMTLAALYFLRAAYHRNGSTNWPTTSGVVRLAALKTNFKKPGATTQFTPFLCYTYTVDGIPRAGTRLDFADGPLRLPKNQALEWIDRHYPPGKQVTVYYDPNDPDLAVLVPGAKELVWICWSVGATAAFCCAASALLLRRHNKRVRSA
jgi:hypothetical protein